MPKVFCLASHVATAAPPSPHDREHIVWWGAFGIGESHLYKSYYYYYSLAFFAIIVLHAICVRVHVRVRRRGARGTDITRSIDRNRWRATARCLAYLGLAQNTEAIAGRRRRRWCGALGLVVVVVVVRLLRVSCVVLAVSQFAAAAAGAVVLWLFVRHRRRRWCFFLAGEQLFDLEERQRQRQRQR